MQKYNLSETATESNAPDSGLKGKIWSLLQNVFLESRMDIESLPVINKYTDHSRWLTMVRPIIEKNVGKKQLMHVLSQKDKMMQVLVMSYTDIADEVHSDLLESFIILEGECECQVGTRKVRLKAGDYLEIPLHEHHHVRLISEYVVSIVQRLDIAA